MPPTPPRPAKRKSESLSGSSLGSTDPTTFSKIDIRFTVALDWTRWASLSLSEAGKSGYKQGNPHAAAISEVLRQLKARKDLVLHSAKLWPSQEENPMYKHFPGYGNRVDLETEVMPAKTFIVGVHEVLTQQCAEHISTFSFQIDSKEPFTQPTSYASIDAMKEALDALPPVPPDEDGGEEAEAAAAAGCTAEWKAEVEARLAVLEGALKAQQKE